jgi:hypothetical protein
LCLERIVGPYRERAVEFTMPPIRNAADLASAMASRNWLSVSTSALSFTR